VKRQLFIPIENLDNELPIDRLQNKRCSFF
jgi:hypothetical protein